MFELDKENPSLYINWFIRDRYDVYTTKLFRIKLNFATLKFDDLNEYSEHSEGVGQGRELFMEKQFMLCMTYIDKTFLVLSYCFMGIMDCTQQCKHYVDII